MTRILLVGCTGFIGRHLVHWLLQSGNKCFVEVRSGSCLPPSTFPGEVKLISSAERPTDVHAVINLAGEPVPGIWTSTKKSRILTSRTDTTRRLVEWMATLCNRPRVFLSASAVGYYGDCGSEVITEATGPDPAGRFRSHVCTRWEQEANRACDLGVRVVNLRLGNVMDPTGGFLGKFIPVLKLTPIIVPYAPSAFVPWISLHDAVRAIDYAMSQELIVGPINLTATTQATYGDLFRSLGLALRRPVAGHIPSWMISAVLGEFSKAIIESQLVLPVCLLHHGFSFHDPELSAYLARSLEYQADSKARS